MVSFFKSVVKHFLMNIWKGTNIRKYLDI